LGSAVTRRSAAACTATTQRGTAPQQRIAGDAMLSSPFSGEELMQLLNIVRSFVRNEEAQDLLEYALLVALIALVAFGAVQAAGTSVNSIFNSISTKLGGVA
jgi:pilus assembly protein Flp/PilA